MKGTLLLRWKQFLVRISLRIAVGHCMLREYQVVLLSDPTAFLQEMADEKLFPPQE
jgi:hypothetical protein